MSNSDDIPEIEFSESDLTDSEDERPILEQLTNRSESEKVIFFLNYQFLSQIQTASVAKSEEIVEVAKSLSKAET